MMYHFRHSKPFARACAISNCNSSKRVIAEPGHAAKTENILPKCTFEAYRNLSVKLQTALGGSIIMVSPRQHREPGICNPAAPQRPSRLQLFHEAPLVERRLLPCR